MRIGRFTSSSGWTGDAPLALVLLHGFGSDERDLAGLGPAVADETPWVSLRGPLELAHGGAAWFPITTPGNPEPGAVADGTAALWDWIDERLAPEARLVPVGFSQGGLMATQLLRTRPERIAATVVLGGFVQAAVQRADAYLADARPPAFWGRGEQDQVIAAAAIERTRAWLPAHTTLTHREYPGLGHGISADELGDVRAFLRTVGATAASEDAAPDAASSEGARR